METKEKRHVVGLALIRLAAICVTFIGFLQLYNGSMAFTFAVTPEILGTIHFVGAFWVGIYLLITGIMGMLTKSWKDITRGFIFGNATFLFFYLDNNEANNDLSSPFKDCLELFCLSLELL